MLFSKHLNLPNSFGFSTFKFKKRLSILIYIAKIFSNYKRIKIEVSIEFKG